LNEHLREKLNPPAPDRAEIRMGPFSFREQDKVMVTRNAYEVPWTRDNGEVGAGMFNGDIGTILKVDKNRDTVYVKVDDRTAEFTFDQLGLLDHAYAITVHKSQGSEFPAVILAVGDTPRRLRYRNLLYTAITRAKRLLIIVGSDQIVQGMVENDGKLLRYTGLERFLLENDS